MVDSSCCPLAPFLQFPAANSRRNFLHPNLAVLRGQGGRVYVMSTTRGQDVNATGDCQEADS